MGCMVQDLATCYGVLHAVETPLFPHKAVKAPLNETYIKSDDVCHGSAS